MGAAGAPGGASDPKPALDALQQLESLVQQPNWKKDPRCTQLMWRAFDADRLDVMKWLHTKGTPAGSRNERGWNMAHEACHHGRPHILVLLRDDFDHGHLFEELALGDDSLHGGTHAASLAVMAGHTEVVQVLVESGIYIAKVRHGAHSRNLAHVAASHGRAEKKLWDLFGAHEVDLLGKDAQGKVPEDLAHETGHAPAFARGVSGLGWKGSPGASPSKGGGYADDFE